MVELPKMGRIVPEIEDSNIRELIIYSYRLIYEISPNRTEILAIIHGKQNFPEAFDKQRKWFIFEYFEFIEQEWNRFQRKTK